jgi:hypothetical protein
VVSTENRLFLSAIFDELESLLRYGSGRPGRKAEHFVAPGLGRFSAQSGRSGSHWSDQKLLDRSDSGSTRRTFPTGFPRARRVISFVGKIGAVSSWLVLGLDRKAINISRLEASEGRA